MKPAGVTTLTAPLTAKIVTETERAELKGELYNQHMIGFNKYKRRILSLRDKCRKKILRVSNRTISFTGLLGEKIVKAEDPCPVTRHLGLGREIHFDSARFGSPLEKKEECSKLHRFSRIRIRLREWLRDSRGERP